MCNNQKIIPACLEETAASYPHHPAVDDGTTTYNWKQVLDRSKYYGTVFSAYSSPKKPIAILTLKTSDILCMMFGCLYADCFYICIDPMQPESRIRSIFSVMQPELVIADEKSAVQAREIGFEGKVLVLEENIPDEETVLKTLGMPESKAVLEERRAGMSCDDTLYGIFTSGSTGVPKGMKISHRSVLDFISHFTEIFGITCEDRMANQAPFDFDVSVKDIYSAVTTGACLILIPRTYFSIPITLLDYLEEKRPTRMVWAVSALTTVTALRGLDYKVPSTVKTILFSGEVMPLKQLNLWREKMPDTTFVNLYGPSEITCNCTYYIVPETEGPIEEKLPIGIPFPGRRILLLDDDLKLVAGEGVKGEICVAGESLSSGYINNEEETAKRFRTITVDGEEMRVYCTGDLGYEKDGILYFSGRKDFQIKFMGHRIELEEVELAMDKVPGVQRSICLFDEEKNRLVAFYMGETDPRSLKRELRGRIPGFMVPAKIMKEEVFPLNKNGKTDRSYFKARLA